MQKTTARPIVSRKIRRSCLCRKRHCCHLLVMSQTKSRLGLGSTMRSLFLSATNVYRIRTDPRQSAEEPPACPTRIRLINRTNSRDCVIDSRRPTWKIQCRFSLFRPWQTINTFESGSGIVPPAIASAHFLPVPGGIRTRQHH